MTCEAPSIFIHAEPVDIRNNTIEGNTARHPDLGRRIFHGHQQHHRQ